MQRRPQRGKRITPLLAGQTLVGVTVLLAAVGLGSAALPGLVSPAIPNPPRATSETPPPVSAGPAAIAPTTPRIETTRPRPGNRAPIVRSATFTTERATALGDLRLSVEAWDPDGDAVSLQTTWWIDGEPLETPSPVLTRDQFARGNRLRAFVVASDGLLTSEAFATPEIVVENAPPVITSYPTGFDATGAFVYPIGVIDADGDRNLEFHLLEGPRGMRIEAHEGTLTWRPDADQVGRHAVRVEVRDGRGGREAQVFALQVRRVTTPPSELADR